MKQRDYSQTGNRDGATEPLSRMSMSVSSIVSPLLLTLVSILSLTHGQDVGETCVINDSSGSAPGTCKFIRDCPVVYQQLLEGKPPKKSCGFKNFDPIICCPEATTQTTKPSTIDDRSEPYTPHPPDENRGAVARQQCAENAKAVYGLEYPAILPYGNTPVNVSRCALKLKKLIVGGTKADSREFPHMTAIGFDGRERGTLWLCGGSLISDRIILTAAHCTYQRELGSAIMARIGDLNLIREDDDARPQTIRIIKRIRHPDYKFPAEYHDIAIMKLETAVVYDAYVRPACLPVNWPDVGKDNKAIATGWGRVEWEEDQGSDDLLKVTFNLVSGPVCNQRFPSDGSNPKLPRGINNDWQLCAGEPKKDTCQGDSGGPLAIFNDDHECMYNIIGITSLGRYCGSIEPGVYTRVYNYIPWIEKTAWPEYFSN